MSGDASKKIPDLMGLILAISAFLGGGFFLLVELGVMGGSEDRDLLISAIGSMTMVIVLVSTQLQYVAVGVGAMTAVMKSAAIGGVVVVVGCLIASWQQNLLIAFLSQLFASALTLSSLYVALKFHFQRKIFSVNAPALLAAIKEVFRLYPVYIATVISSAANIYLLDMIAKSGGGHVSVGVSFVAQQWKNLVMLAPVAVGDYVLRVMSLAEKSSSGGRSTLSRPLAINILIAGFGAAVVAIFSTVICSLHGYGEKEAQASIIILVASSVPNAGSIVMNKFFISKSQARAYLLGDIVWAASAVVACSILTNYYGLIGYCGGLFFAGSFQFAFQCCVKRMSSERA